MTPTLDEFSRVVAALHQAAADPALWAPSLAAISLLCGASKGTILDIDPATDNLVGFTQIGYDPAVQREYEQHYFAMDPTSVLSGDPHQPHAAYEHFPAAVRARSEYFQFTRRSDIGDMLGVCTHSRHGQRSILSLHQSADAPAFEKEHKRLLALVVPHLETAKCVQRMLAQARATHTALAAGLDGLRHAAFIVDASQAIQHLNAAARKLFAAEHRIRGTGGKLTFSEPRLQAAFRAALRAAAKQGGRSHVLPLPATAQAPAAEVMVSPLHAAHELVCAWQRPLVLVMISLPPRDAQAIAARMEQLYGFTRAEARVVALLAVGHSVEDIARLNGVRESTLRSQLHSIRSKTGVHRQADLVRLALSGAPVDLPPA